LGREWSIEITVDEIRTLRKELGINLLAVFQRDSNVLQQLATDPVLLVDTLCVLLEDSIKKKGIDERSFNAGLVGQGIENAVNCLVDSIVLFSPPHQKEMLSAIWAEQKKLDRETTLQVVRAAPSIAQNQLTNLEARLKELSERSSDSLE
jgi:hypothetical protein